MQNVVTDRHGGCWVVEQLEVEAFVKVRLLAIGGGERPGGFSDNGGSGFSDRPEHGACGDSKWLSRCYFSFSVCCDVLW